MIKRPTAREIAEEYHVASSNMRASMKLGRSYEQAPDLTPEELNPVFEDRCRIPLAEREPEVQMTLEQAILARVSSRAFSSIPLDFAKLSKLLYLANGTSASTDPGRSFPRRNAPSSGGLCSSEIYCIFLNVSDTVPGIYYFDAVKNQLVQLRKMNLQRWLEQCSIYQEEFSQAAAIIVLVANVARLSAKYEHRGYRLALLDAGHVSQNIYLVSTALSLNVCAIGGFIDSEINQALDLDGLDKCAVLALAVGERK